MGKKGEVWVGFTINSLARTFFFFFVEKKYTLKYVISLCALRTRKQLSFCALTMFTNRPSNLNWLYSPNQTPCDDQQFPKDDVNTTITTTMRWTTTTTTTMTRKKPRDYEHNLIINISFIVENISHLILTHGVYPLQIKARVSKYSYKI